jgi:hypothetical protein
LTPSRWRCVLLSGPAGSGKTTVCRLGHHAMRAAWGHPAAAIDTDDLYANVDARWELPYDDARNAMVLVQAARLAVSLFEHGWPTVMVCGNSLFDPADTAPVRALLEPRAQVYHVTLAPGPARLAEDADLAARRVHPGSVPLDNSTLTPEQTLAEIVRLVGSGVGLTTRD